MSTLMKIYWRPRTEVPSSLKDIGDRDTILLFGDLGSKGVNGLP